ncbi:MAG TPA: MotA/TolQ/ExbB proton channel family protein [Thermoanaerobaculia bacterium]|jgi:biopolymer transport protein TolQ|nr:MotA/TolQ/ExbB proton channel family protein [Thermoanaerobaculia bacterium]
MFTTAFLMFLQIGGGAEGPGMFRFFAQGGPMGKFILGLLVLFSVGSWAIIFGKLVHFRRADRQSERFLEAFHRSQRFSEVNAVAGKLGTSPLVGIFQAGYAEIDSQIKNAPEPERPGEKRAYRITSLTALERTLARAVSVELRTVTRWLGFLATTASATPFIGLFGTVWGIMRAFNDIGLQGSTSIVAVAPGIAEALINTAAGLAAAIPALIAYNYFSQHSRALRGRMEDFVLEFLNLAERNFT